MKSRFKNFGCFWSGQRPGCPTGSAKARQICLLRRAQKAAAAIGCPIDFQQTAKLPVLPESRADESKEPGETVTPLTKKGAEAQEQIGQQCRPNLPFDGVGIVAKEVSQLEGLFEFLKEDLDAPTAAVKVGDGLGAPSHVVGQENHFPQLTVHLDEGGDTPQLDRINVLCRWAGQCDQIVPQNVSFGGVLKLADNPALQIILGTSDPKDTTLGQVGKVSEVEVSLVKDNDFTRLNIGAKLTGPAVVMFGGSVHDGASWQESLEIKPDVAFGGGFTPTMFGPVQRSGHQLNGGRVHNMDEPLESERKTGTTVASEVGLDRLQMFQHCPEKLFGHLGIAGAIGIRKCVFGRRRGPAQRRERTGVKMQGIAHIIEPETVSDLGIEQADDMTPRAECAGMFVHTAFSGQLRHKMRWNEVAKLTQQRELVDGWLTLCFVFHTLPCGRVQTGKPTFLCLNP